MKTSKLVICLLILPLIACGKIEVSILSTSTPTTVPAVHTSTATAIGLSTEEVHPTAVVETPTPTLILPTTTQVQQQTPATVPVTGEVETAKIFLIALEDNGRAGPLVGCGDSAVPVTVTVPRAPGVLEAAMEKLLSAKHQYYGASGLYNALYQSNLEVAEITSESGRTIVHLTGSLVLGGACDAPRLKAQIEQTALQFSPGNEIVVYINDVPLDKVLSQK